MSDDHADTDLGDDVGLHDALEDPSLPGCRRGDYVFPDYGGYCVANVPGTVGAALGADVGRSLPDGALPDGDYSTVVVVLVDGLGWDRFSARRGSVPLLGSLSAAGRTTPLTSVYPSETAAAITTMHTGATPAEHGVLGWNVRLPERGRTCAPLPFVDRDGDDLAAATDEAPDAADLFDAEPVYERLADAGVESHTVHEARLSEGAYSAATTAGATRHGCESLAEFALAVRRRVEAAAAGGDPTYVYAYWSNVDGASHAEGTTSELYDAELEAVCGAVERELATVDPAAAEETLLVLTADHGHVDVDPSAAVDLSTLPAVWDRRDRHPDGSPVRPTGGPRNVHLHLRDGAAVERARGRLEEAPFDARVLTGTEALEAGLFGPGEPSDLLRERVGDLVVVPRDRSVWFGGESRKLEFVGTHGGQHPAEQYVPFVAAGLDEWNRVRES
ncbi:alkaline phosphatase family protein [Halobaculum sp. EA56]|uniref:alkaline phosphatase family protein n=1 Tax=Halobaculum sp. EA56 TaxID=3421648 RepID=UPI003EC10840